MKSKTMKNTALACLFGITGALVACGEGSNPKEGIPGKGIERYPIVSEKLLQQYVGSSMASSQRELINSISESLTKKVRERTGRTDVVFNCILENGLLAKKISKLAIDSSLESRSVNKIAIDKSLYNEGLATKDSILKVFNLNDEYAEISDLSFDSKLLCRAGGVLSSVYFESVRVIIDSELRRVNAKEHTVFPGMLSKDQVLSKVSEVRKEMESMDLVETAVVETLSLKIPEALFDLKMVILTEDSQQVSNGQRNDRDSLLAEKESSAEDDIESSIESEFDEVELNPVDSLADFVFNYELTDEMKQSLIVNDKVINIADKAVLDRIKKETQFATEVLKTQSEHGSRGSIR